MRKKYICTVKYFYLPVFLISIIVLNLTGSKFKDFGKDCGQIENVWAWDLILKLQIRQV